MRYFNTIILIAFASLISVNVNGQNSTEIISVEQLQKKLQYKDKPLLMINFWATWCGPCIKELPYFESAYASRSNDIHLLLVNLDFADKVTKVNSFIEKKGLTGEVVLLDDLDYNSWIDKIDPSWSGAIPATLLINTRTGERLFLEGEMDQSTLESYITELIP